MSDHYRKALIGISIAGILHGCGAAHQDAGKRLEDQKDYPGAIAEYKQALQDPNNKKDPALHLALARCDFANGDTKGCEEECKASIDCDSKIPETHILLAQAFLKDNAKNEALEQFNMASTLDEHNAVAFLEAGKILDANGDSKGALAKYEAAVKGDDNSADAHEAYAKALGLSGDMAKAKTEMARAEDLRAHPPKPKTN
ncbi:MAG TPA: tetratricopeptide repeat protein [Planktothrix sp.]